MESLLIQSPEAVASGLDSKVSGLLGARLHHDYPVIEHGEGVFLYDSKGKEYLDGSSGAIVANIGHGVDIIGSVAQQQISRVAYTYRTQFSNSCAKTLAEKILAKSGDKASAFFLSSGSEANEAALRLALQYWREHGRPTKQRVLSRRISYHGNTLGALSLSSDVRRRELGGLAICEPLVAPCYCYRCPFGKQPGSCQIDCADDLERAIRTIGAEQIAAFFVEPIIGATGGAVVPHWGYFAKVREICDRYDILLIADEVITGLGRTGKWFGLHHWGVASDITVLGKGLNGGYTPLSAVLLSRSVTDALADGSGAVSIGNTHSGNPLSAAICNAVLDYVDGHDLVERAANMGPHLAAALRRLLQKYSIIGDVRGMGMLWAVELVQSRGSKEPFPAGCKLTDKIIQLAFENGLILYPCRGLVHEDEGDAFLIAPPLIISEEEIEILIDRLDTCLSRLMDWLVRNSHIKGPKYAALVE
ncbi:MAG: aminotransferase class III-fold pyridoxal phosphate-dependent enzyme [Pseudomonadota bacterium]